MHVRSISNRCLALMVAGQGVWEGRERTSHTGACWHASGQVAEKHMQRHLHAAC